MGINASQRGDICTAGSIVLSSPQVTEYLLDKVTIKDQDHPLHTSNVLHNPFIMNFFLARDKARDRSTPPTPTDRSTSKETECHSSNNCIGSFKRS